jgi:hypothetical protein
MRKFYATLPIDGYLNWFMISAMPVQLQRHTEMGMSLTARLRNRRSLIIADGESRSALPSAA